MTDAGAAAAKVKNEAQQAAQAAEQTAHNPWVERLARLGYVVRGVLYGTVGLLAVQVALGTGGATTDKNGAIAAIGSQPFGKFLLVVIVIGLIGYSLWGFVRAIFDPLRKGTDPKGIAQRIGYVVSGVTYGALVIPTWRFITSGNAPQSGGGTQQATVNLLGQPWGPWVVGLIGLISMGGGLGQIYQGWKTDFKKDFKAEEMSAEEMKWATRIGRYGMMARGVVFAMLGFFLVEAALNKDANKVRGLDGALATLAHQPYGPWLLGIVALGLVSFGIYSILCARWIRIWGPGSTTKNG